MNRNHADAAFAIFTGDLAHKGEAPAYEALKREVDKLAIPYHLMVGNQRREGIGLHGSDPVHSRLHARESELVLPSPQLITHAMACGMKRAHP